MCAFNAKIILNTSKLSLILRRLASQLYENHNYFENAVLIGIQPRGKILAEKLKEILITEYKIKNIDLGFLDITFFRDDFGRKNKILSCIKNGVNIFKTYVFNTQ